MIGDAGVDFGAGMAGDEADDPLDLRRLEPGPGIGASLPQPVEPQHAVGIDHHLLHQRVR